MRASFFPDPAVGGGGGGMAVPGVETAPPEEQGPCHPSSYSPPLHTHTSPPSRSLPLVYLNLLNPPEVAPGLFGTLPPFCGFFAPFFQLKADGGQFKAVLRADFLKLLSNRGQRPAQQFPH